MPASLLEALDGRHGLHPATEPATEAPWPLQREPSLFGLLGAQTPDAVAKVPLTTAASPGYRPWHRPVFQGALWHHDPRDLPFRDGSLGLSIQKGVNLISSKGIGSPL